LQWFGNKYFLPGPPWTAALRDYPPQSLFFCDPGQNYRHSTWKILATNTMQGVNFLRRILLRN
jgi:hypothetical protein